MFILTAVEYIVGEVGTQMKKIVIAMVIAILLVGGIIWAVGFVHNQTNCSIGYYGTAASITYSGIAARQFCDEAVANDSTHYYLLTEDATGTILCEGDLANGPHYIVRDTGLFDIVGSELCHSLQKLPSGGSLQ